MFEIFILLIYDIDKYRNQQQKQTHNPTITPTWNDIRLFKWDTCD